MNKIMIKQKNTFSPKQKGRAGHVSNCIAAELCPDCGSNIFVSEEVLDKELGRLFFFECSTCEWKNYNTRNTSFEVTRGLNNAFFMAKRY